MARCNRIVVLSNSWKEELQDRLGGHPFVVVENGVPIPANTIGNKDKNKKIQILFLGNLTERKGVWDLIKAMQDVEGAVLNFVGGEEDPGIFQEVEKLINNKNLQNKIVLHGPKHDEDKYIFLQNADIFVLPSYAEGLPISLLEAMAIGLPVIVTPVGGIPSVVTNQKEGVLVKAGQVEELLIAMNMLVQNQNLRQQMGMAARKRCEEQFSIENTVQKLLTIYSEVF